MLHSKIASEGCGSVVSLAELVAAFSHALDITEGQPVGHCIRACWIGSHIGQIIGLDAGERADLYYMILLKDLGCSSNAARICELYEDDDRAFKQGYKTVGTGLAATLHFVFARTARKASLGRRAAAVGNILRNGDAIAQDLIVSRCTRGADIARSLRFSNPVCDGIYRLDEHWDGSGRPGRRRGGSIPLYARIALLAQIAEVFHAHAGQAAACDEIKRRAGTWLDPWLVDAFLQLADKPDFWAALTDPALETRLPTLLPTHSAIPVDDAYLDAIAAAFGQVIDAKSPFTAGHSTRVAELADVMAGAMGCSDDRRRWLYRAALLHDVGKLGVSNQILDKPGRLDADEWVTMRNHASQTQDILGRIGVLADIAPIAAAHHERPDGRGYPHRLSGDAIAMETRIITACDIYDALTADRPYRAALSRDDAIRIMTDMEGNAVDAACLATLRGMTEG